MYCGIELLGAIDAGILDGVDQRTQLAGHNRFELLLFKLAGKQRFGINIGWSEVSAPPKGVSRGNYLTAVTRFDDEMIEVIYVEKVMSEVMGGAEEASEGALAANSMGDNVDDHILIVDDSSVARNQVKRVLDQMGIRSTLMEGGAEAWNHLQALQALQALQVDGVDISKHYSMIISDVEMPQMGGYTLASKIKADKEMKAVYLVLHTSLSGVFNTSMVEKVGADEFIAKFKPDALAEAIQKKLQTVHEQKS